MKSSIVAVAGAVVALYGVDSQADSRSQAIRLFDRLAGVPIGMNDPRLAQMQALIEAGKYDAAAKIATNDDGFYNITLKHFALPLSSTAEDPVQPLNDFTATLIGIVRDDLDGRTMLTGNFIYKANDSINYLPGTDIQTDQAIYRSNNHYNTIEQNGVNLRQYLVQAPQKAGDNGDDPMTELTDNGGLMTTRSWAASMLSMGTNRRPVQYAFHLFLCTPIGALADASLPDERIWRDITRVPGGDVTAYQSNCRSCHSVLDPLAGAWAHFDFNDGAGFVRYFPDRVSGKLNRSPSTYPQGYITKDNSWINYATVNHNAAIGWPSNTSGRGVNAFGQMLANTEQFPVCMARRVFTEVCRRPPSANEAQHITNLAATFKSSGYKLKRVFEKAAVLPACLGE